MSLPLRRNLSIGFIAQIFNSIFAFISSVVMAKLLGAEVRGEYNIYLSALTIFSVWFSISLTSSIVYHVGAHLMKTCEVLGSTTLLTIITSILVFVLALGLQKSGAGWIISSSNGTSQSTIPGVFALTYLIGQLNANINSFLTAKNLYYTHALISTGINLLTTCFWILCLYGYFKPTIGGFEFLMWMHFSIIITHLLLSYLVFWKVGEKSFQFGLLNKTDFLKLIKFAAFAYACNAIQILTYKLDYWFVDYFHGAAQTGIYSLAVNLGQMLWILPNTMASVLLGHLSGITKEESILLSKKYLRLGLAATIMLSCLAIPLIHFFLEKLYSVEFISAKVALYILLPGITGFSATIVLASYNGSTGQLLYNLQTSLVGLIAALILYTSFIPTFGIKGAAFSSTFAYLFSTLFITMRFLKSTQSKMHEILPSAKDFLKVLSLNWK
jgi:O-antigen/teichoic acid export membrane protein